jgi:cardiolipin synthase
MLLTANLTTEALTRNVELGIQLTSSESYDLYQQFLIGFWRESSSELLEPGSLSKVELITEPELSPPEKLLSTMGGIHTLKEGVERLLGQAKSEITVTSFGIDSQHETTRKIIEAARNGKRVRIMARPRQTQSTMSALMALAESGCEVRGQRWLHAKCVVVDTDDGWSGLVMTANFEPKGLDVGFESGIFLRGHDAEELHETVEEWWRDFPQIFFNGRRLNEIEGNVDLWDGEGLRPTSIQQKGEVNLGEFRAKTFEEMDEFTPDLSKAAKRKDILYHECKFRWTVLPPRVPPGALKVSVEDELQVNKLGQETFVVIQRPNQMTKAQGLASKLRAKIVSDS